MKRLLSFFTLLTFVLIAFFQNSMMSFAMEDMNDMKMEMSLNNHDDCLDSNISFDDSCNHECCYESAGVFKTSIINSIRENKKVKIKIKSLINIFSLSIKLHENKNLTKITSPPNTTRKVKNYSYKDLTKIIKSNT